MVGRGLVSEWCKGKQLFFAKTFHTLKLKDLSNNILTWQKFVWIILTNRKKSILFSFQIERESITDESQAFLFD